jgi:hypothetical protein
MGGTGIAFHDTAVINILNPASLSFIRLSTFETATFSSIVKRSAGSLHDTVGATTFGYFALAFPVSKRWGAAIGLQPFSVTGYNISSQDSIKDIGTIKYNTAGSGGLNQFFIASGIQVLRKPRTDSTLFSALSLGVNSSILFGSLKKVRTIEYPDQANALNLRIEDISSFGDLYFGFGMQYAKEFLTAKKNSGKRDSTITVTLGFTGSLPAGIATSNDTLAETYIYKEGSAYLRDTIINATGKKGSASFPASFGFGLAIEKPYKWLVTAEASVQQWSQFRSSSGQDDQLKNSFSLALGTQFIPDHRSPLFRKTVRYRLGARYSNTYLYLDQQELKEYGISFGFGFPIVVRKLDNLRSYLNLAFEAGQRGKTELNPIKEQFIRFIFAISFSDKWFVKPKYY